MIVDAGFGWITNPTNVDTDNDGLSDYIEEVIKKTNPLLKEEYHSEPLGKIPETSATNPKVVTLTPSKNSFIVRVTTNSGQDPLENAQVTLSRTDYNDNPDSITKNTDQFGICRFENADGLEFDNDWTISVSKTDTDDTYTTYSGLLIYFHTEEFWNYVDNNPINIEIIPGL